MEAISASDHLYWRMIRQGFRKIRHSVFQKSPFRLLIGMKMPSPCPEMTSYDVIPVAERSVKQAGDGRPEGRKRKNGGSTDKPAAEIFYPG